MAINPACITCDVCGEGYASPFSFLGTDHASARESIQKRERFGNGPQYIISKKTETYLCKKHEEIARRYGLHTLKKNEAIAFLDSTMIKPSILKGWIILYRNRGKPTPLPGNGLPQPSPNEHKKPFIDPEYFDCEVCGRSDTTLYHFADRNVEVKLPQSQNGRPPSNEMLSMFGEGPAPKPPPVSSPDFMSLYGETRLCPHHKNEADTLKLQHMFKSDALAILKSRLKPRSLWENIVRVLHSIIRVP